LKNKLEQNAMKLRFCPRVSRPQKVPKQTAAQKPAALIFDFSLDKFRGWQGTLTFKFVFLIKENHLVIGPDWIEHRKIAAQAFGSDVSKSKSAIIGAMLTSRESNGKICFNILGKSGFYGLPAQEHLRKVANHIAGHLTSSTLTEESDDQFYIDEE
jgi:hypothetical protein